MPKFIGKIRTKTWLYLPAMAVFCFLVTELLNQNPGFTERYYSQALYPVIANISSLLSSLFPFSLNDLFYFALIALIVALIVLLFIRRITFACFGKILLNTLAAVYILFYSLWGFNYYRPNLYERLELSEMETNKEVFIERITNLIEQTNALQCTISTYPTNATDKAIEMSYEKLAPVLKINYPMGVRPDKKITCSRFFAQTGIAGYFGPFFNEVHVNTNVHPLEYPFVLAHEKAHQLGVTSEAEANFYAWLVCTQSTSQYVQYSGNLTILRHFLVRASAMDEFPELADKINRPVKDDINAIRTHWNQFHNEKLDKAASKMNDDYLKTNKVKGGIKDYSGVVKYVMNFSLDSAFQERHHLAPR